VRDGDGIHIALGSGQEDDFLGTVEMVCVAVSLISATTIEDEHLLGTGALKKLIVPFGGITVVTSEGQW
jgi:hypothetical protein